MNLNVGIILMMGGYLSEPITKKSTATGHNDYLSFVAADMQGWRVSMQDAICYHITLPDHNSVFGVFDGHGGCEVSRFTAKHFVRELINNERYKKGDYENALVEVFKRMDEILQTSYAVEELKKIHSQSSKGKQAKRRDPDAIAQSTGCTANVLLITAKAYYVANAGDSRAVLCRGGKAIPLSTDHKPDLESELDRIRKAGGKVENGRVNGGVNLSRSIGDLGYKDNKQLPYDKQLIICKPDVTVVPRANEDNYIVMGCDGIWDGFGKDNQGMVALINRFLQQTKSLQKTVHAVMDKIIAPSASSPQPGTDNMSMVLVYLQKP